MGLGNLGLQGDPFLPPPPPPPKKSEWIEILVEHLPCMRVTLGLIHRLQRKESPFALLALVLEIQIPVSDAFA